MKKAVVIVALCAFVALSVYGQEKQFSLSLGVSPSALYNYPSFLSTYEYYDYIETNGNHLTDSYGAELFDVDTAPGGAFSLTMDISYGTSDAAWGVSGWMYSDSANAQGSVSTPAQGPLRGVCLPGVPPRCLVPTNDERTELGYSDVSYQAEEKLAVWSLDLYRQRAFSLHSNVRYGIRVLSTKNDGYYQVGMTSWIENYNDWGMTWDNVITLTGKSDAKFTGVGPFVSLGGTHAFSRTTLSWSAGAGVVLGQGVWSGFWHDEDQITLYDARDNASVVGHLYYDGQFPYRQSHSWAIPVTELSISLGGSFLANSSWRGGLMGQALFNVPLAPLWSAPGEWQALDASGWRERSQTLIFGGPFFSFAFSF